MVSYWVDLTSVYSVTVSKFVLTSVSASVYYFSFFVGPLASARRALQNGVCPSILLSVFPSVR